jgi:uncharacterized protein involved in exopolysaccharide biosynthesis
MVDWYLASLQITPVRGSSLCNISFIGTSPELITRIVNTHARTFIAGDIQRRKTTAQEALNWLKARMNAQKTKLETSNQAIYEYNKALDITSLEGRRDMATQELMSLISAHTRARADRMGKQAVWDHVKNLSVNDEKLFAIPGISRNLVIRELRSQLIKAREEQREERARVSAEYPRNHQLDARIKRKESFLEMTTPPPSPVWAGWKGTVYWKTKFLPISPTGRWKICTFCRPAPPQSNPSAR